MRNNTKNLGSAPAATAGSFGSTDMLGRSSLPSMTSSGKPARSQNMRQPQDYDKMMVSVLAKSRQRLEEQQQDEDVA